MTEMIGGRERTADEYERLPARSGFTLTGITPLVPGHSIVEARPG